MHAILHEVCEPKSRTLRERRGAGARRRGRGRRGGEPRWDRIPAEADGERAEEEARAGEAVAFAPFPTRAFPSRFRGGDPRGDAAASASSASAGALPARVARGHHCETRAHECPASEALGVSADGIQRTGTARDTDGQPRPIRNKHARCAFVVFDARCESRGGPERPRCHRSRSAPTSNAARIVATVVKKIDDDPASGGPQTGYSRARFRGLGARLGVNEEGQEALVLNVRRFVVVRPGRPGVVLRTHPSWTSKTARIFIVVGQSARMRVSFRVIRDNSQEPPTLQRHMLRRAPMLAPSLGRCAATKTSPRAVRLDRFALASRAPYRSPRSPRPCVAHTAHTAPARTLPADLRGRGMTRAPVR